MTQPRPILPGKTYLITRRTSERRFFLRPSPTVNAIVEYCLAYALHVTAGIHLHEACFLSNHYHLVLTDLDGNLPAFMHRLNLMLARGLGKLLRRHEGGIWAKGSYSAVELTSDDAILEKAVYTLTNPVKDKLVRRASHWPGVTSRKGPRVRHVQRPSVFDPQGSLPEELTLTLTTPPSLDETAWDQALQAGVQSREAPREPVMGPKRVLQQNPYDSPQTPARRTGLSPTVAGRDQWKRIEALQDRKAFLQAYHQAKQKLREGIREVLFPYGTYAVVRWYGCLSMGPPAVSA